MQKFARFFGLQNALKVSNQDQLFKIWHETIDDHLEKLIQEGIPEAHDKRRIGYLFDFNKFLQFLENITKSLLKDSILQMIEKMEFSQGLSALRIHTGKQISFRSLIANYETMKEEKDNPKLLLDLRDTNQTFKLGL